MGGIATTSISPGSCCPQPGMVWLPGCTCTPQDSGCAALYPPQPERLHFANNLFSSTAYFQQKITEYHEQKKHRRDSWSPAWEHRSRAEMEQVPASTTTLHRLYTCPVQGQSLLDSSGSVHQFLPICDSWDAWAAPNTNFYPFFFPQGIIALENSFAQS